jgi:hypothetical protein
MAGKETPRADARMSPSFPQLPTLRGVRVRLEKPRRAVAFQGWCVCGDRVGVEGAALEAGTGAVAAALARAAVASASSFWRQQCLYLRPDPQRQTSLRPGRAAVGGVIKGSVSYRPHGNGARARLRLASIAVGFFAVGCYARNEKEEMERETGFEPATSTLARSHSTTELFPPRIRPSKVPHA